MWGNLVYSSFQNLVPLSHHLPQSFPPKALAITKPLLAASPFWNLSRRRVSSIPRTVPDSECALNSSQAQTSTIDLCPHSLDPQWAHCEKSLREVRMCFEWWGCFAYAAAKMGLGFNQTAWPWAIATYTHSGACIWEIPVVLQLASGNYHRASANNMLQS